MNTARSLAALSIAVLLAACASPGATPSTAMPAAMRPVNMGAGGAMAAMDPRMTSMQEMHQKMHNASTPAQREALMTEHMTAMQGGMAMMKEMQARHAGGDMGMTGTSGSGSPMAHSMMANHMGMMQMMMDMMADRMSPAATVK